MAYKMISMIEGFVNNTILAPLFYRTHSRAKGQEMEVSFWNDWVATKGGKWGHDFQMRMDHDAELRWPHNEIVALLPGDAIEVLDVGSGPITKIGYKAKQKKLNITACDPNAELYDAILAKHNLNPPVKTIRAEGETLSTVFSGPFEYITCTNALDHARDPDACIAEMMKLLSPEGAIFLFHEVDEGKREGYRGYHKWNICGLNKSSFAIWNPSSRREYLHEMGGLPICVVENGDIIFIVISNNNDVIEWAKRLELKSQKS